MVTTKEFNSNLVNEVLALETSKNLNKKDAFLSITSSLLEDIGIIEDFKNCYLSKELDEYRIQLDGYSISESETTDFKKLDLIISSYSESSNIVSIHTS